MRDAIMRRFESNGQLCHFLDAQLWRDDHSPAFREQLAAKKEAVIEEGMRLRWVLRYRYGISV